MTYHAKSNLISVTATLGAYIAYIIILIGRSANSSLVSVPYASLLLLTLGLAVIVSISGSIVIAALSPRGAVKKDTRSRQFDRSGGYAGFFILSVGGVAALGFSMLQIPHFWIANILYLTLTVSMLTSSVIKIVYYRRAESQS